MKCRFIHFSIICSTIIKITQAIINGTLAHENTFKYQVSIWDYTDPICSGAVIDKWHILTAAHCVEDMNRDSCFVRAGSFDLGDNNAYVHGVERIQLHPEYKPAYTPTQEDIDNGVLTYAENDVAVLTLSTWLNIGERIQSIPLSTGDISYRSYCKIAGWGVDDQNLSWTIQMIPTPSTCEYLYVPHRENEFCAMDPSTLSGPSEGDSGSPLECDGYLVGILLSSFPNPGYPATYAKVRSFSAFIADSREDTES